MEMGVPYFAAQGTMPLDTSPVGSAERLFVMLDGEDNIALSPSASQDVTSIMVFVTDQGNASAVSDLRVATVTSASATLAVSMGLANNHGSVTVRRDGEGCSVTKI